MKLLACVAVAAAFVAVVAEDVPLCAGATGILPVGNGDSFIAHSMLTRDGRRMVSRLEGGKRVYSLVPTNQLPANLPPVREWTLYAVKSAHTDIGLHNSQYIQRHGTVRRIDEARRLIAADPADSDPGAFRYVAEGTWFWGNYPQDRGEAEAMAVVTNEIARGRLDVGVTCAGNHTHLYGFEELCRSIYTKRELEDRWGIKTRTMLMTDNPGISWSIVAPYAEAGVEHVLFSPNHWNPHPSTIWKMDENRPWKWNNPDAGGGGSRIDVRWASAIPMLFWWEAPQGGARLLVWTCPHYGRGGEPFGIITAWNKMKPISESEPLMARQLAKMEARYPYDVWLFADYEDDEWPSTRQADLFKKWNAKWKWPQLRTCGRLDEPFDRVKARWGDKIPTLRGEMTSGWLQHAACTPDLLARKMAADRGLARAETLMSVISAKYKEVPSYKEAYPAEDFRRAWDALIWNDEHSYGVSGYQGRRVFETWMQHRDWIERAEHTALDGIQRAIPGWIIHNGNPNPLICRDGTTENRWYRVAVTNGVIYSIYDKELGRELLEGPANEFRYTRDNHKTWTTGDEAMRALGAEMVQRVWLASDEKKIVLDTTFRHARDLFNTNRYDRFGYMAFPFAVPQFRFAAQLNGPVIDPLRDQSGLTSDAYTAVRDWCAVENGEFGVALVMADSCLTEFGEIHPDKTCYGGPVKSSGIYPYLFTDWLQMHNPDGDSFNFRFRYVITSYSGTWQSAHIPAFAERALDDLDDKYYGSYLPLSRYDLNVDSPAWNVQLLTLKRAEDGRGLIARFREREGRPCRVTASQHLAPDAEYTLCNVIERDVRKLDGFAFDLAPFGYATIRIDAPSLRFATRPPDDSAYAYTGLITAPRAGHGEKDGQMYILWGAEMSHAFDHYELWRDGKFLANVTNEVPNGIPYRVARYEDLGLPTHSRHEYRIRKVWKDGRKDPLGAPFWGLTRQGAAIASPSPVVTYRAAPDGFPGAVLVTADADGAPHFDCVGEAAPGRRMEPDTVFWMASNTKGVLAALVLNLVSEGKLSLDDPVEKYFPSWKKLPVKNRPTLRMLLCHTSGLDVFPKKAIARPGMEALAEHVHVEPLKFEPDTKYLYSNWDIDVAAAIVEKVTGRPFEVEMAERIFKPLGMTDSTFIPNASQNARRATFYKLSDKKPPMPTKIVRDKLAPPYMEVGVHPEAGGGLLSTPQDMIKFFQMIARGGLTPDGRRLISAPLMEKWTAKQTPSCVKVGYSFGMKVDGKGGLSHGGAGGTWAEANVKTRKVRLYMVNMQGSSKIAKSFRNDWMKKTELAPARVVVTEAGADPTGKTDSTAAIQKCIDRVSAAGGGTVVVPPGVYRILYLSLRPHVRLELAGGVERATDGWTPEVAARAMDPARSAIIRSVANRKGHWSIFLYNLVPRTDATNGVSDVTVSGGVFDCQGRHLPAAFACGRNIRFENAVVKDISNNHALQIDGCENVVVTNCLFAGYVFKGAYTCMTRETIQVEQTSPGALGNPETSPISCAKGISIPNRNVSVTGCWFGPSERLGPHLVALGHHGRARSCNGLVFSGNVVVNPLYCGVRLANVSDARVENNTFISTNATKHLADDSAVVCLWGGAALKPGEKGVVLRGNKIVLSEKSPLRRLWTTKARQKEVTEHDFADAPVRYTPIPGGYRTNNGDGEFNRPLYGWHGDDRELSPCKSLPWTSDRPKVALKMFRGYRIDNKVRGVLQFGDGTEDVEYRYVWGRAEYDLKGKGTIKMVRSAQSDGLFVETTGDLPPKFDGEWELAAKGTRGGTTYYDFERKGMRRPASIDPVAAFDAATNHFERIARTIEIKTPDPVLDSLLPCQLLVADAMFEGRHITHGATNWKQAFAGWRVAYICYATGWEERFKENAREHFRSQRADGRIPNEPKRDSFYNMCEEFVVSVMRYWKWTHDDDFMREIAYDGVKRHLEWMDCNMKVPDAELYENWLNTWDTDDKWTNGGAGTISSAYYAFDCRVMSEVAQRLGKAEDAAYFAARSKAVEDAIAKNLWHEGDGVWGEYRERFGLKRLMRAPDLSTVYIAIDNLVPDLARNRRAVFWVEDNVPTFFAKDGASLLYSSNRLPLFWTSCGRYPDEMIFWALACYQAGEPELGWRNLHDAAAVSARGAGCGPGVGTCDLNFDFACYANIDFADNTAGYLRAVTEGVFGIVEGREIRPSFPASWNEAEIKSPYISYRWTRTGGVEVTGGSRAATVKVVPAPKPQFAGAAIPPRHTRWGHPKGEGSDLIVPQGAKAEFVDLSKSFNQNLRLLHAGKYSPRIDNKPWSGLPRTIMANGRTWWEHHETVGNRHWPKDYAVPKTLERWPEDGALATKYGPAFHLGPKEGKNAAFTSFYEQFPDAVEIPLSGKARKLALLSAVVTNPNVAWMEAACVKVQYADGTEEVLSLVPPDNCDDWLNYSQGQWSYYDAKRDNKPYAVRGRPVMLGETAHANAHALVLDPAKELKSLRIECRGTETFVGLLAATLYR